jgi:hypothetical protein
LTGSSTSLPTSEVPSHGGFVNVEFRKPQPPLDLGAGFHSPIPS